MSNTTTRIIAILAILALLVSAAAGSVVTQDVEIRGSVAYGSVIYDYANFAGFWYDLDKDHSSEVMNVTVTGNRTVDEGDLVYTCTPQSLSYKNPVLNTEYGGYMIMGFMAEKYICYDDKTDELVKLLINWGSSKDAVLSVDDPMELPEGYMLTAAEIDLQGDKVWLKLYKDGECIDDSVIIGGSTYIYEDDDDVLLFSAKVDSVFRGTESNLVVVKYIFMRSDTILDINGGDAFGVMEVKSTSGGIVLRNDDTITLDSDSEVEIMDGMYFKVADSSTLRYYLAKTISLECPECPECPVCLEPEPCPEVTPEVVIEYVNVTVAPDSADSAPVDDKPVDDSPSDDSPGFGAVFAILGLLAVAYLVYRRRT